MLRRMLPVGTMLRWVLLLAGGLFVLPYVIRRDVRFIAEYPSDLRNRIVGARMIEDGRSPYFYHWAHGDGLRYYDPQAFDDNHPSITTSTPFLHRLLIPIADLPQARISVIWLIIEYVLLVVMGVVAWGMAKTTGQRQVMVLLMLIFLLTNAWKSHTWEGQTYILVPFFALLVVAAMRRGVFWGWGAAAGTAAACLVLDRPDTLLFFLPFLFLWRRYPLRWKLAFVIPVLMSGSWILLSGHENRLWQDYTRMLGEWVKIAQDLPRPVVHNEPDPHFSRFEGIDIEAARLAQMADPVKVYSENGNVFVVYQNFLHRKLPVGVLEGTGVAVVIVLLLLCMLQRPWRNWDLSRVAIFGFCLYMVVDLFSPVYRHQHYEVQWLMPLLVAAATFDRRGMGWYGLVLFGLVLGCIHFSFIKMGNTIGEYLIMLGLLGLTLFGKKLCTPRG